LWNHETEILKPPEYTAQYGSLCISETYGGQFPQAKPTCNPEWHLTPRHAGLNPFVFHVTEKTLSPHALVQSSPLYDLGVSSAFLCQTLTIQHEIILLDDCLGWGWLVVVIVKVAVRVILPIPSNEAAISEIRHVSPKEINGSQNGLESIFYACSKISTTSCIWEDLTSSCLEK